MTSNDDFYIIPQKSGLPARLAVSKKLLISYFQEPADKARTGQSLTSQTATCILLNPEGQIFFFI